MRSEADSAAASFGAECLLSQFLNWYSSIDTTVQYRIVPYRDVRFGRFGSIDRSIDRCASFRHCSIEPATSQSGLSCTINHQPSHPHPHHRIITPYSNIDRMMAPPNASTPLSRSPLPNGYQSNRNSRRNTNRRDDDEEGVGFLSGAGAGVTAAGSRLAGVVNLDNNGNVFSASIDDSDDGDDGDDFNEHKTTFWQTYIHLVKGYIGCGVLSLPWAVSQLGVPVGCVAIVALAYWSSYSK